MSTVSRAAPSSWVIRSYDACAVVAVSGVKATLDRSLAVSPDASAVAASWGSGSSGFVVVPESPVQPATPRTRASVRAAARDLVAHADHLYRPPPSRPDAVAHRATVIHRETADRRSCARTVGASPADGQVWASIQCSRLIPCAFAAAPDLRAVQVGRLERAPARSVRSSGGVLPLLRGELAGLGAGRLEDRRGRGEREAEHPADHRRVAGGVARPGWGGSSR